MADLIDRQAVVDMLQQLAYNDWNQGVCTTWANAYSECADMVESLPTADAIEVVRCKDCKWFNDIGCSIRIVDDSDKPTENDYCSFGERNDG